MRLNRKQKICRNLLLCILLGFCACALMGFPPYTVRGMCRQVERDFLLEDRLEPLYVVRDDSRYVGDSAQYTFIVARGGDTYLSFQYKRNVLQNWRFYQHISPKMAKDVLCAARDGVMYIAGPFQNAASATIQATVERTIQTYDAETGERRRTGGPETRTFILQGEKVGEELFIVRYRNGELDLFPEEVPEAERDLEDLVDLWYRVNLLGENGQGLLHADVPVTVTWYDEGGAALGTVDLTMDTYELHSW